MPTRNTNSADTKMPSPIISAGTVKYSAARTIEAAPTAWSRRTISSRFE